jgi:hypothetical protein
MSDHQPERRRERQQLAQIIGDARRRTDLARAQGLGDLPQ